MTIDTESLKAKFDLRDYAAAVLGSPEKQSYDRWQFQSPFINYEQRTGSLHVKDDLFICRATGIGGDIIKFVQLMENCTFIEACNILGAEKVTQYKRPPAGQKIDRRKGKMISMDDVRHYASQVSIVTPYLQQRSIDEVTMTINNIGGLKTTWAYTFKNGETIYPTFRRVAIPSIVENRVTGFIQRRDELSVDEFLLDHPGILNRIIEDSGKNINESTAKDILFGAKYWKLPGVPDNTVFGANQLVFEEDGKRFWRNMGYAIVVESHFDYLTGLSQMYPTLQMKHNKEWNIQRIFQGVKMVFIIQQNDDPGRELSQKLYNAFGSDKNKAFIVNLPEQFNDINDMAIQGELNSFLGSYPYCLTPNLF